MKKVGLVGIVLCCFYGCSPDLDYTVRGYTQKIIVEGVVETDKYPVVYLSLNVPLWKNPDSLSILDHVIRYAKVTISDGTKTEILTSRWDKTHFPPYGYRATEITGVEGKTYDLKVEYGGYTLYSSTFLPVGTTIERVEFSPSTVSDTLKIASVWVTIDKLNSTGFRIFTKKRKDKRFLETPLLFNENLSLQGSQRFNLSPRSEKSDASFKEGQYFALGDTIDIKLCALDSVSSRFFKGLGMFSTLAGNLLTNELKPLPSNISEPGFGIWYGSAVRTTTVVVK